MTIANMPSIYVGIGEIIGLMVLGMALGLDIKAIRSSLLADKVQIATFRISEHPQR